MDLTGILTKIECEVINAKVALYSITTPSPSPHPSSTIHHSSSIIHYPPSTTPINQSPNILNLHTSSITSLSLIDWLSMLITLHHHLFQSYSNKTFLIDRVILHGPPSQSLSQSSDNPLLPPSTHPPIPFALEWARAWTSCNVTYDGLIKEFIALGEGMMPGRQLKD